MRLSNAAHESRPWRIREIVPDFVLEDVWALPVHGGAEDFQGLLELMASSDPANAESLPTRMLWSLRDRLGSWFDLGRISASAASGPDDEAAGKLPIPGTNETSLAGRLAEDLRNTAGDLDFGSLPFTPLYRTDAEFAAEISNRTVHGVMHLAWVDQGGGRHQGQMAVYVKPRGRFGKAYMALIKPFRYWIVYPALMRQTERAWNMRDPSPVAGAKTIYEWAGGTEAFERWLNAFYDLVEEDAGLAPLFGGRVSEEHRRHVLAWWVEVMGGPADYTANHGGYPSMLARHRNLGITPELRLRFVTLLSEAADRAELPADPEFRAAIIGYAEWGSRLAMHNSEPGAVDVVEQAPVPRWGWGIAPPYEG